MVLHELSTNARKYGALSGPEGKLAITWHVRAVPTRSLRLEWQEHSTRSIAAPTSSGFGTTLIERMLSSDGGSATMVFADTGLTCTLTLPLDERGESAAGSQSAFQGDGTQRAMIIEDEPLIAMEIEALLADLGYAVVGPFSSVAAALQAIEEHTVNVAVLDANLQGESVAAVAAALRRKSVPFVFATGYSREGLPLGFDGVPVLAKPFGPSDLKDTLASVLGDNDPPDKVVSLRDHRKN
jgi:CheY-like chemotaxis protein